MKKKTSEILKYVLIAVVFFTLGWGLSFIYKHYCPFKGTHASNWWTERGIANRGHCLEK